MNSETGRIMSDEAVKALGAVEQAKFVQIDKKDMTAKQFANKQVSICDNRSKLGKLRRNTYNNLRNKPCICGSGIKFKKCCWFKMNMIKSDVKEQLQNSKR